MIRSTLFTLALLSLAACETAKGAGQDIENAGRAIGEAAKNVQEAL